MHQLCSFVAVPNQLFHVIGPGYLASMSPTVVGRINSIDMDYASYDIVKVIRPQAQKINQSIRNPINQGSLKTLPINFPMVSIGSIMLKSIVPLAFPAENANLVASL